MSTIAEKSKKSNTKDATIEWIKTILLVVIIVFLVRSFLFESFIVDGHSMDATLQNGERLIVNRLMYDFHAPQRGDIIVFHATPTEDYIKRVIAVEGDTVEAKNGVVYVNGKPLQESYLDKEKKLLKMGDKPFTSNFGPITVPKGNLFAMGDNRPNSYDSRMIGPVEVSSVVGRADLAFWPPQRFQKLS
jgi:signal peptidase I